MASEAVATVALIVELSLAPIRTSRALTMVLSSTYALALFGMRLVAWAPAPLTGRRAVPAMPAAGGAAPVSAVIPAAGIDARVLDVGLDLDGCAHAVAGPADQVLRERRTDRGADAGGATAADGERRRDDLRLDGRALMRVEGDVTRCAKYAVAHESVGLAEDHVGRIGAGAAQGDAGRAAEARRDGGRAGQRRNARRFRGVQRDGSEGGLDASRGGDRGFNVVVDFVLRQGDANRKRSPGGARRANRE